MWPLSPSFDGRLWLRFPWGLQYHRWIGIAEICQRGRRAGSSLQPTYQLLQRWLSEMALFEDIDVPPVWSPHLSKTSGARKPRVPARLAFEMGLQGLWICCTDAGKRTYRWSFDGYPTFSEGKLHFCLASFCACLMISKSNSPLFLILPWGNSFEAVVCIHWPCAWPCSMRWIWRWINNTCSRWDLAYTCKSEIAQGSYSCSRIKKKIGRFNVAVDDSSCMDIT